MKDMKISISVRGWGVQYQDMSIFTFSTFYDDVTSVSCKNVYFKKLQNYSSVMMILIAVWNVR